ncbi:hypothetical protein JCM13580A_40620 [Streptomyces drozdowiczii]
MEPAKVIETLWARTQGDEVASEVEVPWTSMGADPRPEWRTGFVEPM